MATATKRNKVITNNLFMPALLARIPHQIDLESFLKIVGLSGVSIDNSVYFKLHSGCLCRTSVPSNILNLPAVEYSHTDGCFVAQFKFVYFESDASVWVSKVEICSNIGLSPMCFRYVADYGNGMRVDIRLSIGQWERVKQPTPSFDNVYIQSSTDLFAILKSAYPYVAEWASQHGYPYATSILAPYLEVLSKAGFAFVDKFMRSNVKANYVYLSRLCQNGTSPKRIFKVPSALYLALKSEADLDKWDIYRKLVKLGRLSAESVGQALMVGLSERELELVHHILGATYANKSVFSWTSLMNYLQRLDTFEAIDCRTALQLLRDYLHMCKDLGLEPKVDSDSLRREHDVTARNHLIMMRQKRDEKNAAAMLAACADMAKLNYREEEYFVRGIKNLEDLYDEANQQRNCVASYANRIANGLSYVFVMREVSSPDKSLITIEIDPNTYGLRQKYLARNEPIRNKAQTEFINRWVAFIKRMRLGD